MNRDVTNIIRYFMDEWIPPAIRDNKYFMYPIFHWFFNGKNIKTIMGFKSLLPFMSDDDYEKIYKELSSKASERPTDLNKKCIEYILREVAGGAENVLDVGCGRGFLLTKLLGAGAKNVWGCDLFDALPMDVMLDGIRYKQSNIECLPFADNSFDVVICSHVLEHVRDLDKVVHEIKRVAKKKVIIVVPKQRYYYYTLDLHIRFFHTEANLLSAIKMDGGMVKNIGGDFLFMGEK